MNGDAGVSVVIPTRDRPRLLEAAVQSVLLQTRPVRQIVVVDDGSTPQAARETMSLVDAHPTVEVHRHPRSRGVSAARNLGLAHVRGDYVLFLDDDDLVHPRLCEDGLAILERRRDVDVVVFLYECIFEPADVPATFPLALLFDYRGLDGHPLRAMAGVNPVPSWLLETRPVSSFLRYLIPIHSCLARRNQIENRRFPEALRQGEDTYFWISVAQRGSRFVSDPRVYAYIRRHSSNTTRSRSQYEREIQDCYEALLADGLLQDPSDAFLAHLKLFSFKLATRRRGWGRHLVHLLSAPNLLAREFAFWARNLAARKRLASYYFSR